MATQKQSWQLEKLNQIASKQCPAGARHLGRHSNAELILESNDEDGPAAIPY